MTLDQELVEALEKDYTTAPITPQERVMVNYVVKLTKDATEFGRTTLRGCGRLGLMIAGYCRLR